MKMKDVTRAIVNSFNVWTLVSFFLFVRLLSIPSQGRRVGSTLSSSIDLPSRSTVLSATASSCPYRKNIAVPDEVAQINISTKEQSLRNYPLLLNLHDTTEKSARALALLDVSALPVSAPKECAEFLADFSESFTSQYGQDSILYYNFWAGRLAKGFKGFYVDLGSNQPKVISNTWFLDKCLGWKGLCIEADPVLAENLRKSERTCKVINMCASGERSTLPYVTENSGGHIATHGEKADVYVSCAPLSEILIENGIEHVDFLSLDIEGNEVLALSKSDWDCVPVELILVESAWSNEMLDMQLHDAGFWKVSDIAYLDDVYIRAPRLLKFFSEHINRKNNWEYIAAHEKSICSSGCKRSPSLVHLGSDGRLVFDKAHGT